MQWSGLYSSQNPVKNEDPAKPSGKRCPWFHALQLFPLYRPLTGRQPFLGTFGDDCESCRHKMPIKREGPCGSILLHAGKTDCISIAEILIMIFP